MKHTKRLIAMIMAVMLIVAMVPLAVSAAVPTDAKFTLTCDKAGFEFTVYTVATLEADGTYKADAGTTDAGVVEALADPDKDLYTALKSASTGFGTALAEKYEARTEADLASKADQEFTVKPGVYFVKCTDKPATVKSVASSLVVAPQYDADTNEWKNPAEKINLGTKVSVGEPKIEKEILDSKFTKYETTAKAGEDVKFQLKATVVGSKDEKLNSYTIVDTHDDTLKLHVTDATPMEVKLVGEGIDETLTEGTDWERTDVTDTGFKVNLLEPQLKGDATKFYDAESVVVTYFATLQDTAVIGNPGNKNADKLEWTNSSDKKGEKDGNEVFVFTFKIEVTKVDAKTGNPLQGAEFTVYASKEDAEAGENGLFTVTSDKDGLAVVERIDKGSYFVKETKTIKGYNLNSEVYELKIEPTFTADHKLATITDGTAKVTIKNTKSKLPQTGFESTMTLTFVGAGLIVLAGALFVIAMRKKTVK